MNWRILNSEAWYAEFNGWHVTKNFVKKDLYNKEVFEYVATKEGECLRGNVWDKVRQKILLKQVNQLDL